MMEFTQTSNPHYGVYSLPLIYTYCTIYSAQRNLHYPQTLQRWREKIMFFITSKSKFFIWLIPPRSIHFPNIPNLHSSTNPILSALGCSLTRLRTKFQDAFRFLGDRSSTVAEVLCYKSEGRWFDPRWCQWIFHLHKILPIALWPWGWLSL